MISMIIPTFCQKDARMRDFDFMYRAVFKETYNAFDEVSGLVKDCFRLNGCPARGLH